MPGKARDGNKGREFWSSDLSRPGQGNSLWLGNQESESSGQSRLSRRMDEEYCAG